VKIREIRGQPKKLFSNFQIYSFSNYSL